MRFDLYHCFLSVSFFQLLPVWALQI